MANTGINRLPDLLLLEMVKDAAQKTSHCDDWLRWTKELLDGTIQAKNENNWILLQHSPIWNIALVNKDHFAFNPLMCMRDKVVVLDRRIAETCYNFTLEIIRDVHTIKKDKEIKEF